jgi:probable HAF family extracellular repeat protein
MLRKLMLLSALMLSAVMAHGGPQTTYRVTTIVAGTARGVNNGGDVTGQLSSNGHAYLYKNGVITDLGAYSSPSLSEGQQLITVTGLAVSDSDVVVGLIAEGPEFHGDNREDAFLWKKGALAAIAHGRKKGTSVAIANGSSEGFSAAATAINNRGDAVGTTDGGFDFDVRLGDVPRAFLYRNNTLIDLGTLGGLSSVAGGINNSGAIVGIASNGTDSNGDTSNQAFLYQNGQMQAIGGVLSPYFSPGRLMIMVGLPDCFQAFLSPSAALATTVAR